MDNILHAVNSLENKFKNIVGNYEFLKRENEVLLQNVNVLRQQLLEKEQQLQAQEKRYNLLKVARTMVGSSENTRDTKFKINALIREIDKCIIQLNE